MKKISFHILIIMISLSMYSQNTRIGITAGVLNAGGRVEFDNEQIVNNNRQGIYGGLVLDVGITERIHLETEIDYLIAGNTNFLQFPLLVKFYMGNTDFYFQTGGQFTHTLDEISEGIGSSNIALLLGAGFDINEHFNLNLRFGPQLNDFQKEEVNDIVSTKINFLNIGAAYKFKLVSKKRELK